MNEKHSGWRKRFALVWIGQAFSLLGSELVQFSLVWYLTDTTRSASVLAAASFIALLPRVVLSPIMGALVDRWNRRKVMILADTGVALATLALAAMFFFGSVRLWQIYVILFLRSIGGGFHWPAYQVAVSELAPEQQLTRISGLNQTLQGALSIAAPPAAAFLLSRFPIPTILMIDIFTACIAIMLLSMVRLPKPGSHRKKQPNLLQLWDEIREGFQYLVAWKSMFYLILGAAVLNFLINPGFTFTPLLVTGHFQKGVVELGVIETAFGIGMVVGGMALSAWGGFRRNIDTILTGIIGLAVGTAVLALSESHQFTLAVVGMGIAGFMHPIANGPLFAVIQKNVDLRYRGRVFSIVESIVSAMMPLSMAVAAILGEWVAPRNWLMVASGGCFILGCCGFFIPAVRNLEKARD